MIPIKSCNRLAKPCQHTPVPSVLTSSSGSVVAGRFDTVFGRQSTAVQLPSVFGGGICLLHLEHSVAWRALDRSVHLCQAVIRGPNVVIVRALVHPRLSQR